jgi:hypothetical protein
MFVFYGIAIALLAAAGAAMFGFGELAWVRRAALGVLAAIVALATAVQFSERCPRCGLRLGAHGGLLLPEQCRGCGVAFHPSPADNAGDD